MYDVIVIGGGHAGIEAALATSRNKLNTLMVVGSIDRIANMPCNPSIGGPAKGILVREIDALGGEMAKAIDATLLQIKMLNSSKGPAVRALRAQADKVAYPNYMKNVVFNTPHLTVKETYVHQLTVENQAITGIIIENEEVIQAKVVIIASGTYLDSCILIGNEKTYYGPDYEKPAPDLSRSLTNLGIELIRLKTGTPARIQKDSIDYSRLEPQYGDAYPWRFSDETTEVIPASQQVPCYLTYTTPQTHAIIKQNIHRSSLFSGLVTGVGPRYCPSIEDKLVRFADKERHQLFIEPESLAIDEMYIQGFSTSLPRDVQVDMIHSLPGLENAIIRKYAYAIEYDAINPTQLKANLETKSIHNLFFAGQVNGTSGYEEAACQGLMAGINASLRLQGKEPLILRRDEAYTGVLIDDLITKGVKDPYRLLTSRAEFRLLLRHDNATSRLIHYGYQVGLISQARYDAFLVIEDQKQKVLEQLKSIKINPKNAINSYLLDQNKAVINEKINAFDFLKRPDVDFKDLEHITEETYPLSETAKDELLIDIKYAGYIQKEIKNAKKLQQMETMKIPEDINYDAIVNMANEAKDKLKKIRPTTLSQASRISGVNPSDISVLMVYIESRNHRG